MITKLSHITLIVRDQDEALAWYIDKLGFEKRVDSEFGPGFRWLTVAPRGLGWPQIVLQQPLPALHGEERAKRMMLLIGQAATWSLETDDCRKDYEELSRRGVRFTAPPEELPWGILATFTDLYGNPFNLIEPRALA